MQGCGHASCGPPDLQGSQEPDTPDERLAHCHLCQNDGRDFDQHRAVNISNKELPIIFSSNNCMGEYDGFKEMWQCELVVKASQGVLSI